MKRANTLLLLFLFFHTGSSEHAATAAEMKAAGRGRQQPQLTDASAGCWEARRSRRAPSVWPRYLTARQTEEEVAYVKSYVNSGLNGNLGALHFHSDLNEL